MLGAPSGHCIGRAEAIRLFVLEAPLDACLLDMDCRFVAASPAFLLPRSLTMGRVLGRTLFEVFPSAETARADFTEALAAGQPHHTMIRESVMPDGRVGWFRSQASYWRDDAGAVAGYFLVTQDITAERETEARRRETEALLEAVVENIPATLTVQDVETQRYLFVNTRSSQTMGINAEQMQGRQPSELFGEERARIVAQHIEALEASGGIAVAEHTILGGPTTGRTLRIKRLLFEDSSGRSRMLSIGEDITDLREAAEALKAAVAEAEAANAAKSLFLANISHEIRTPLNGVLGMAQAMARDVLPAHQRERLEVIRQSGESLLTLLNDLLDLSKIEAGKIELEHLEFDVDQVVRDACAAFEAIAEEKGLALELRLAGEAGLCRGDPTRLRQVVANLVSNALKFTEEGRIDVCVSRDGDDVCFSVADTGLGMAPATVARMFEKFSQADVSTTRRFGGTGLGLAICRDLVELMGGRISVESAPGQGSRFTFSLPLPCVGVRPGRVPATERAGGQPSSLRVLAAEDNHVNRLVLTTLLEQVGLTPVLVENGAEAVEAWAREEWDVILMDVQMPVMDGPAATILIRSRERAEGRRRTPIIALTANAMAHHAAEYLACGMDTVVSKPIQIEALLGACEAVLAAQVGRDDVIAADHQA